MSSSADTSQSVRVRGANFAQWLALAPTLAVVGFGLYVVILVLTTRHAYYAVYGLTLGALSIACGLAMMAWTLGTLRGLKADPAEIRFARGWRWQTIPLTDVCGVGLLFLYSPGIGRGRALPGWYLTLWSGRDGQCQVPQFMVSARNWTPPGTPQSEWHLPNDDVEALARSKAGGAAIQVAALVDRVQGPDGALAMNHAEKHVTSDRSATPQIVAWWSPDGTMGRI